MCQTDSTLPSWHDSGWRTKNHGNVDPSKRSVLNGFTSSFFKISLSSHEKEMGSDLCSPKGNCATEDNLQQQGHSLYLWISTWKRWLLCGTLRRKRQWPVNVSLKTPGTKHDLCTSNERQWFGTTHCLPPLICDVLGPAGFPCSWKKHCLASISLWCLGGTNLRLCFSGTLKLLQKRARETQIPVVNAFHRGHSRFPGSL